MTDTHKHTCYLSGGYPLETSLMLQTQRQTCISAQLKSVFDTLRSEQFNYSKKYLTNQYLHLSMKSRYFCCLIIKVYKFCLCKSLLQTNASYSTLFVGLPAFSTTAPVASTYNQQIHMYLL